MSKPHFHFIGICGTGMGSLAGMLAERGYEVRGSDKGAYPPMSTWLEERSIPIMKGFLPEHLDWEPDLVVVGNVCRRDNPEAVEALNASLSIPTRIEQIRSADVAEMASLALTEAHITYAVPKHMDMAQCQSMFDRLAG